MAGIGFALRDLMRKETLWSVFESQLHGVIAVAGPWFFTIASMSLPTLLFDHDEAADHAREFVTLLLYVFSISLTITSPLIITLTRHVSDAMYARRSDDVAAAFSATVAMAAILSIPALAFGAWHLQLDTASSLQALCAYGLITLNWIAAPMLSTFRQFRLLTGAYAIGTLVFWLNLRFGPENPGVSRLLTGFNYGLVVTNGVVCGLLLHNFPGAVGSWDSVVVSWRKYRLLAVSGGLYGLGLWIDKWLMWAAPEHVVTASGLASYPEYDTAMFLAYITTVPALALFIIRAETAFQEKSDAFYAAISGHADHQVLESSRREMETSFVQAGRDVLLLQAVITTLVLLAPTIVLDFAQMPHTVVFMLRFCALGAMFHLGALLMSIVLLYFDSRWDVVAINAVFLLSNLLLTLAGREAGLRWYGVGYFLSGLLTFGVAWLLLTRAFRRLLYLAFIQQNPAVAEAPAPRIVPPETFETVTGPSPLAE